MSALCAQTLQQIISSILYIDTIIPVLYMILQIQNFNTEKTPHMLVVATNCLTCETITNTCYILL